MKKSLLVALAVALMLSAAGCGNENKPAETAVVNDTQSAGSTTESGNNYTISIPMNFTKQPKVDGAPAISSWQSPDYENNEFEISAYDVGYSVFTNEQLPETFEQWRSKSYDEPGVACEEILFKRSDSDNHEIYTVIAKVAYSEGSGVYDIAKLNAEIESINVDIDTINPDEEEVVPELPAEIIQIVGKKVIVDKNDRSKAIVSVITSNDVNHSDEFESILDSFEWKD